MVDKVPGDITPGTASRGSKVHATQADNSLSRSHDEEAISRLQSAMNNYSASLTYGLGDLIKESPGGLVPDNTPFINITAIATPEAFDPAKWSAFALLDAGNFVGGSSQDWTGDNRFFRDLAIIEEGGPAKMNVTTHSSDDPLDGAFFTGSRSRGTIASSTAIELNDIVTGIKAIGFNGTDFEFAGFLCFTADENWSVGNNGMRFEIFTTANGSATQTKNFEIGSDGTANFEGNIITNAILESILPNGSVFVGDENNVSESFSAGLETKQICRAATNGNITLANLQTVDGVSLIAGDRVLVKNQTQTGEFSGNSANGIYIVVDGGAWTRSTDADTSGEVNNGMFTKVTEGTVNADTAWVLSTPDPITLNTTKLVLDEFDFAHIVTLNSRQDITGRKVFTQDVNIVESGSGAAINVTSYSNDEFHGGAFVGSKARGIETARLAVINDDLLASFAALGYTGTTFNFAGFIDFTADGTWTNSSNPTKLQFFTTDALSTSQVEQLRIGPDGTADFMGNNIESVADPVNAQDAATKNYVDNLIVGLSWKEAVVVTSTINIDLSSASDPNPIDSITLTDGQRILLQGQTDPIQNGIYDAVTATNPTTWVRSSDMPAGSSGDSVAVFVSEGTINEDNAFVQTNDNTIVGTNALSFVQFSGLGQIVAGAGLTKNANTLNVGAGTGITVNANDVALTIPVVVSSGGTGAITLDSDAVLTGNGTGVIGSSTDLTFASSVLTGTKSNDGVLDSFDFILDKHRASTGTILANTSLGKLRFFGRNVVAGASGEGARIESLSTENFSVSSSAADLRFSTTPEASTSLALRLLIDQDGTADFQGNDIASIGTLNTNTIPAGTDTFAMLGVNNTFTERQNIFSTTESCLTLQSPSAPPGANFTLTAGIILTSASVGFVGEQTNDFLGVLLSSILVNGDTPSTIPKAATLQISGAPIAGTNITITESLALDIVSGKSKFDGDVVLGSRLQGIKGANVASADAITLVDGNYFDVTGTTTINHMLDTNWQSGSEVTLQFDGILTVTNAAGGATGDEADFALARGEDFVSDAGSTLTLVFDGTNWHEISRNTPTTNVSTQLALKTANQTLVHAATDTVITDLTITLPTRAGGFANMSLFLLITPSSNGSTAIFEILDDGTPIHERLVAIGDNGEVNSPQVYPFTVPLDGSTITVTMTTTGDDFTVQGGGTNNQNSSSLTSFEVA